MTRGSWLFALSLFVCACSGSEFKGSSQRKKPARAPAKAAAPAGSDASKENSKPAEETSETPPEKTAGKEASKPPIPDNCDASGATQADLLTPTTANGKAGNYLEYELSVTDCEGKKRTFAADVILFDLDAVTDLVGKGVSLSYTIIDGKTFATGKLKEIQGSDLFGKIGKSYYHNETDQPVKISTETTSVRIRIDLLGMVVAPSEGTNGGPVVLPSGPVTVATYLRFGKATPVRKDVVFK